MAVLRSLRSRLVASCIPLLLGWNPTSAQQPADLAPALADEAGSTAAAEASPGDQASPAPAAAQPAPVCPVCGGQQPATDAKKTPAHKTCCCGHVVDWSKIPLAIRPMPRGGNFPIPPTGPGYYSLTDHLTGTCRKQAPKSGYPPFALMPWSFFDADFRFVDALPADERAFVEELKRIQLNDCLLFSTGGQVWTRFMNEHNARLTEFDNSYTLVRTRAFGDLNYGDLARVYGEYIWADTFSEDLVPLPIDADLGDILNLFLDVNLFEYDGSPVILRTGRQELLFGSQRLVSPLDWANTRRTFDGVRLMRRGEKWDFDVFAAQPVLPPLPREFDRSDELQDFAGAWLTYRPEKGRFLDFYYLYLDNSNTITQAGIERAPFEANTFGSRWTGDRDGLLWDYEVMLQLGDRGPSDLAAGAATAGLGRHFKDSPLSTTAWVYYDYASGDATPNVGDYNTFNQLYPFGHYYLGWIDLVGRQNIQDLNGHLIFYPKPWITMMLQYHHFWLAQSEDALYGVAGAAIRRDPTGAAGNNVGDEVDLILNFHVARYSDVMVGYSKLFGGRFLEQTAGGDLAADSELLHLMLQQKW